MDITSILKEKNQNKSKYKNSIEFINYMEVEYIQNQIKKNEKIFQLSNYKKQNKKKLEALQFSQKTTLSSRFFKDGNLITSITVKEFII